MSKSKYDYEQFILATEQALEKMTHDATGVRKNIFAAGKLDSLTTEKQKMNLLYSAVRDVGGDENHPIIKALTDHMKKNGIDEDALNEAIKEGKDYVTEKTLTKAEQRTLPPVERAVLVDQAPPKLQTAVLVEKAQLVEPTTRNEDLQLVLSNSSNSERSLSLLSSKKSLTFEEILASSGVVLSKSDETLMIEAFHKIGIIDRVPKRAELLSSQIALSLERVIENNPGLQPFANDLFDSVLNRTREPATQLALEDKFTPLRLKYQPEVELDRVKKATTIAREELEIEELSHKPTTRPRSNALSGPEDERAPRIERLAQDSIIFGGDESGRKAITSGTVGLESSEVDPITAAIRKEILAEQQKLLKKEISISDPTVTEMDATRFREYLTSEKGKEEAAKVFAKPEIQTALNEIEVKGYREVHTQFQESFKNVAWAPEASLGSDQPKTKSCEIKNEEGQVVANIKETTHDKAPIAVTLEDGSTVNVKSFRTIDFPKELENGKGPLHLSMAVKDENGKNIAEKNAVYFTAHYDEKGKLTEVSSPVPVKFMGKGDDAVGYIERNGKVYTLPVTQGKYKEMMREVAKNKGMGVDLSQEVEKPAQDLVMTRENTREPAIQREEETIKKPVIREQSIDSIQIVEHEPTPLKMVLPSGLTGAEKTQEIDKLLKGATPEQVVATLKDQVSKGGSEIVGLIVESTKQSRVGDHPNVPTLTAEQFKEVYDAGMQSAKNKVDAHGVNKPAVRQRIELENVQASCGKLATVAGVNSADHQRNTRANTTHLADKLGQGASR